MIDSSSDSDFWIVATTPGDSDSNSNSDPASLFKIPRRHMGSCINPPEVFENSEKRGRAALPFFAYLMVHLFHNFLVIQN